MGNYITRTNVQDRLRRSYTTLYTPKGASEVDTDLVDADIDGAEGEVDGYLAQRYTVPVTAAQALRSIRSWCLTLVEEIAYGAIPGRKLPESISTRAAAVRTRLEAVADGSLSLGSAETPGERADAADAIVVDGETPVMGRTNLAGF